MGKWKNKRKNKRFNAHGVFAAFVSPDEPVIVGKVLDVSLRGAAVLYLGTRKLQRGPASIKIFGLNYPFMERIESTVIYDLEIPEESLDLPMTRRCGIKFEGFGLEVMAKIRRVLQNAPAAA
jgi:hypothetical protein